MLPNTKATIAFGIGTLAAFYAAASLVGLGIDAWFALRGGTLPASIWVWALLTLIISAPVAVIMFRYRRSQRRIVVGACARCGYDLRASSDRCPECGAEVPTNRTRTESRY